MAWKNKEALFMTRPGVTYLDVSSAAQQLAAAGKTPTIETVRILLGTGSNSTLGTHLRAWKTRQDSTQQIATKENIPEELIASLKGVWERVMDQSASTIQTIQQETQQELATLKQAILCLQKDSAISQQQCHQAKQERDGLSHEKSAVEQLLAKAKIEAATLTEKLAGFEQQSKEKQMRIDELHRQNQQIQTNLEHYRTASLEQRMADQQRYEQHQQQLEQTIQQVNQELAKAQRDKSALEQKNQHAHFEKDNLKAQLDKLNAQHELMTTRHADMLTELAKKTQDQQHWESQYHALQVAWDKQNKTLIELQTQRAVLAQQLEIIKTELKETQEQNKELAHEKWMLGQEKAQLYGQLKQLESYV